MAQANQGSYYAVKESNSEPKDSAQNHEIAKITLSGGDTGISYSCSANLSIEISGDMTTALTDKDAFITLTAERSTGFESLSSLPLKTIIDDGSETYKNMNIGFSLKSGEEETATIKGDVWLVNTDKLQNDKETSGGVNDISNKSLTIDIKVTDFSCDIAESVD